jgi:hypothetical protein
LTTNDILRDIVENDDSSNSFFDVASNISSPKAFNNTEEEASPTAFPFNEPNVEFDHVKAISEALEDVELNQPVGLRNLGDGGADGLNDSMDVNISEDESDVEIVDLKKEVEVVESEMVKKEVADDEMSFSSEDFREAVLEDPALLAINNLYRVLELYKDTGTSGLGT